MNFYYYKKYLSNYLVKYFLNENKHKTTEICNIIIKCESREVLKIILSLLRLYKSLCPAVHRCTCTSPTIPSEVIRGLHHAFYNSIISTHLLISVVHYLGNRQISISSKTNSSEKGILFNPLEENQSLRLHQLNFEIVWTKGIESVTQSSGTPSIFLWNIHQITVT